jgi:hypothetical protein
VECMVAGTCQLEVDTGCNLVEAAEGVVRPVLAAENVAEVVVAAAAVANADFHSRSSHTARTALAEAEGPLAEVVEQPAIADCRSGSLTEDSAPPMLQPLQPNMQNSLAALVEEAAGQVAVEAAEGCMQPVVLQTDFCSCRCFLI